ncbi:BrnT family toxin [Hyphomicrobium album]|uniref:BrnT family toxin n=1 Tax=Hyphomicrobium album TaxID=2665159 RepID=UPI002D21D0AD|nr:BrnT family toxin [Hyphomicrobium album]
MGPAKAATNVVRHGVTFERAKDVFVDQKAIEALDESSSDEERWRILGRSSAGILMVVYTERRGRIRIISARMADKRERKTYLEQE